MQPHIYKKLGDLVAPGPAEFYRDAAELVEQARLGSGSLRSATHLIFHLAREIESALRDVLELVMDWGGEAAKPKKTHEGEVRAALRGLGISESDPAGEAWLALLSFGFHSYAHRDSLATPRPPDSSTFQTWDRFELVLDVVLERFAARYGVVFERLDVLLQVAAPSPADVEQLRGFLPNSFNAAAYFFGRLESAAWLKPLLEAGFFRYPPRVQRGEEEGSYRYPNWPQAWYIARVAADEPEAVAEIIAAAETDNPAVHDLFLDALLKMPADIAAPLTPSVISWAETSYPQPLGLEKHAAFVARLADGGFAAEALSIARALLVLRADEREKRSDGGDAEFQLPPRPRGRVSAWDYRELVAEMRDPLVRSAPEATLALFCDLLAEADGIMSGSAEEVDGRREDYSYIWHTHVDSPGADRDRVEATLVHAVWTICEALAASGPDSVPALVEQLESRGWTIFHRIALMLLATHPEASRPLIQERLADHARFADHGVRVEYDALSRCCFGTLDPDAQDRILAWIEAGLTDGVRESLQAWTGPVSDQRWTDEVERWRRARLEPVSRFPLPDWARRCLSEAAADPGNEPAPGHLRSPVTVEEARAMGADGLVSFARTWRPGESGATWAGLGHVIEHLASEAPAEFALVADRFAELPLPCVRGLLAGVLSSANAGTAFSWGPVLALCREIAVAAASSQGTGSEQADLAPEVWVCRTILDLLRSGLAPKAGSIPADLRERVWCALEPLTRHWDPLTGDGAAEDGDLFHPAYRAVRSHAAIVTIEYVQWVRRSAERNVDAAGGRGGRGLDDTPEARRVFERHLDPELERSPTVRAAYGSQFPWLIQLDRAWAESAVPRLFPADKAESALCSAAWRTYLRRTAGYDIALPVLREQYARAIATLDAESGTDEDDPARSLADHILGYYFRGLSDIEDPADLASLFATQAGPALRAYSIQSIARGLARASEPPAPERVARLQRLWETWFADARLHPQEHQAELAAFGWWFAGQWPPAAWSVAQLTQVVALTPAVDARHGVVERLAEMAAEYPRETAECLNLIAAGLTPDVMFTVDRADVRKVLKAGLSADDRTRSLATETINRLAAYGWPEFLELLRP